MTVRYLLDTSVVSSPASKRPDAGILSKLVDHEQECVIAAPVWHELTYGCQRLPRGKRRQALVASLQNVVFPAFPVLAYDDAAAHWHQVAAIAHVHGLTLVTVNTRDFTRFNGLTVEDWRAR